VTTSEYSGAPTQPFVEFVRIRCERGDGETSQAPHQNLIHTTPGVCVESDCIDETIEASRASSKAICAEVEKWRSAWRPPAHKSSPRARHGTARAACRLAFRPAADFAAYQDGAAHSDENDHQEHKENAEQKPVPRVHHPSQNPQFAEDMCSARSEKDSAGPKLNWQKDSVSHP
jgi:hypothetical protein